MIKNTTTETTSTKSLTEAALAAKAVRAALKASFPGTTFRVRSENFSMGDAVRISWVDGPATEAVELIAEKFTSGSFDGYTDCYEYKKTAERQGPTAKYVTCSREISASLRDRAAADIKAFFSPGNPSDIETMAYRVLRKTDLRQGYEGLRAIQEFPFFAVIPSKSALPLLAGIIGSGTVGNDNVGLV